jgi:hypothetical protein
MTSNYKDEDKGKDKNKEKMQMQKQKQMQILRCAYPIAHSSRDGAPGALRSG